MSPEIESAVFNIAVGRRNTLNELLVKIKRAMGFCGIKTESGVKFLDFRGGDMRRSQANIGKAEKIFPYTPNYTFDDGLKRAAPWHVKLLRG